MTSILKRLFNLRPNEWRQFFVLYAMFFIFVVGITWAENSLYGAVVEQGIQFLPPVQIGSAIVALIITGIYAAFVDRIANDRLLIVIAVLCVVVVGLGLTLLLLNLRSIAFPLLYLLQQVIDGILGLHWWTFAINLYDTRTAKRILPLLASSGRVGAAAAGFTYRILTGPLGLTPGGIVALWMITLATVAIITWFVPILRKESAQSTSTSAPRTSSYINSLREGYQFVLSSSFLRWMAISALLLMIITKFMEYQAGAIFRQEFANAENVNTAISNFTADLTGITNLLMLLAQIFLFNRLIGRIGLGNANLIYPFATLGVTSTLVFLPASLMTGALSHFDRTSFRQVFRSPIDNLLFNAVPLRVKGRARAFINGLVVPVGVIIAGILLGIVAAVPISWILPALLASAAIAYTIVALRIRKQYAQALVTMLEQEDFSFLLSQPSALGAADPATVKWLTQRLEESNRDDLKIFLAGIMLQVGGKAAIPILSQTVRTANSRVRAAILEIIVAADIPGNEVYSLYTDFLGDEDGRVRRAVVAGLEECLGNQSNEFLSLAFNMRQDPEVEVLALVIPPLLRSNSEAYHDPALESLNKLLAADDARVRARGIRIMGQVRDAQFVPRLLEYLSDTQDEVRVETVLALEMLSNAGIQEAISEYVLANTQVLLNDPVERVRAGILTLLGQINNARAQEAIIGSLADASPRIRQVAVDTLVEVGQAVVPALVLIRKSPNRQLRSMTSVALSRIHSDQFDELLDKQIRENLDAVYDYRSQIERLQSLNRYPSISVLQVVLRERIRELLADVFYLLAVHRDPENIQVIRDSLNSETASARSNALEALESLTSPQIVRDIAPLVDPSIAPSNLVRRGRQVMDTKGTIRYLLAANSDPWLRTIATFSLGEIGSQDAAGGRDKAANPSPASGSVFSLSEITQLLGTASSDPVEDVRIAARAAQKRISPDAQNSSEEKTVLSAIEKIIFLKEVSFFQSMSVDQLKALADISEEVLIEADEQLFDQGDPGGALYVVVNGRIGVGLYSKHSGMFTKLSTMESHQAFGEMGLFDNAPRSAAAVAVQHSLLLRLRREPLLALARQYPDLSLELIGVLSHRLRQANEQIANLSSSLRRPMT